MTDHNPEAARREAEDILCAPNCKEYADKWRAFGKQKHFAHCLAGSQSKVDEVVAILAQSRREAEAAVLAEATEAVKSNAKKEYALIVKQGHSMDMRRGYSCGSDDALAALKSLADGHGLRGGEGSK